MGLCVNRQTAIVFSGQPDIAGARDVRRADTNIRLVRKSIENMVVFRVRRHDDILAALRVGDAEKAVPATREQTAYLRERFDAAQAMNRRKVDAGVA